MIKDLQKVKGKYSFKEFFYTVIFSIVIAIFLTAVNFSESFLSTLIFSEAIGISISLTIHLMLYFLENKSSALKLFAVVSAVIIGTILGVLIASSILGISLNYFFNEMKRLYYVLAFSLLFSGIISYIFISREMISVTKNELLEEKVKNVSTEKSLIETNLRLLHTQIEPHFLFNTLSTILSFIETDPQKGKVMMEDFINLLRSSLSTTREKEVSLEKEIDVLKSYLNIFKVRMGDRLNYKIDISDEVLKYLIPSMLIQPLVENAIRHGLEPKIDGGEISVSCIAEDDKLKIEITDTGMGIDPNKFSNGVGIENVRKRLDLLYGKKAQLIIEENKPSGVKAILRIPYETNKSDNS